MNRDHCLGFFAGLAGGLLIGITVLSRRKPSLRKLVVQRAHKRLHDLKDIADSAGDMVSRGKAAIERQSDAVRNAVESGKKSYFKTAG
jgi:hypothetical protein